jgi:predicted alpha/beta-fold hydrolase
MFTPRKRLRNGHLMTLFVWARPRRFPKLPPAEERVFQVADDARVLAHCHWQADRAGAPLLLALHGLEGSSHAHYMRGLADKAYARGFNVVRLNQRNCGGTEHLSAGLYHSGLTPDADRVIREVTARDGISNVVVAGYSLGGNLALKLAGDYGNDAPPQLRGIAAVSPVADLEACVRALEYRHNIIYQWNFVRGLRARMRRKAICQPGRFSLEPLRRINTVRQFDAAYTAPHFGFSSAEDYYYRASALRVVDRIRIPTLIISAEDDPFVPAETFRLPSITGNRNIQVHLMQHGGHCGFLTDAHSDDGYWAERTVVDFAARVVQQEKGAEGGLVTGEREKGRS